MTDENDSDESVSRALERVPTGIGGLDTILSGGLFRGGVYMLLARPGCGKTILGNQICFRHVQGGGRAVIVTLLTESHARMTAQLQNMEFFDASNVGTNLFYVAGYQSLEKENLRGLLMLLRQVVRDQKATFLMIDGLVTAGSMAASEIETKKFIHELQIFSELVGCTTLLLTGESGAGEQYALRTMVDGLFELHMDLVGMEAVRTLEATKFRGGKTLLGRHLFDISDAGITVFPRTESFLGRSEVSPESLAATATFANERLDAMLGGGLSQRSLTMVLGAPGSGKTLLGLSFLAAGAREKEPGLYFGFVETPAELTQKAATIGIDLSTPANRALVELAWHSPLHTTADALAEKLLSAVRERSVKRLFIDGFGAFKETLVFQDRSRKFFAALCNELRSLGVVTLFSDETRTLTDLELPDPGLTSMLDNVILLRHIELQSRLHKHIFVTKMRDGAADSSVHEFSISDRGFVVSPTEKPVHSASSQRASKKVKKSRRGRKDR